jgi:Lrp/AsnC family leucine-responsive transcriptional regulator
MLAERGAALEAQRRIHRVRAGIDPALQGLAAGFGERRLHQAAVFHDHHVPAEIAEHGFEFFPQPFAHHGIEALAVVIDHPPGVAQAVLPALQQRLEDIALVHLGVADQRDHSPLRAVLHPAMRLDVVLHQRGKQGLRHAEADRAGGEIDVVGVLGARRIGLRALEPAEIFQFLPGLVPEQILDGVEHGTGVRLHRDAVLRLQHREIQRRHDGGERGRRGLMAADLQPVGVGPDVVGVMDGPRRQPQHLAGQRGQQFEACGLDRHGNSPGTVKYPGIITLRPSAKISNCRDIPAEIGIKSQSDAHNPGFIPMHSLDAIDRKILNQLQADGRTTMQELADKVGLSVSPCHRRVKLLEQRGVITRYIATVDQKSLGLHVSVFISIKLARQKEEDLNRFAKAISKWDEVLECYLMTGNRDYLLRVVAADLSSYEAFLKNKLTRLDGIASIESSFALSQVKYSIALPV